MNFYGWTAVSDLSLLSEVGLSMGNASFTEQPHYRSLWAEPVQEVSALSFRTKAAGDAGFISSAATDINTVEGPSALLSHCCKVW